VGFLVCSDLAVLSRLMLRGPAAKRNAKRDKANLSKLQVGALLLLLQYHPYATAAAASTTSATFAYVTTAIIRVQ